MKRLLATTLVLAGLAASSAQAQNARLVDISVRDLDRYATLPEYRWQGRQYVAGEPGHRFAVTLRNQTGERVLAVLSVDGVNAISGQTASASQSGYVLEPWQTTEVRGWRKNYSEVAEFYFTDLPDSYAARTGRPDNVGVIGIAAYRELRRDYDDDFYGNNRYGRDERSRAMPAPQAGRAESARSADAASAPAEKSRSTQGLAAQEIGTGHGQRRYDPARATRFERESSRPNQVTALYYDSYEALVDRGIIRDRYRRDRDRPEPFPVGFAPDPHW